MSLAPHLFMLDRWLYRRGSQARRAETLRLPAPQASPVRPVPPELQDFKAQQVYKERVLRLLGQLATPAEQDPLVISAQRGILDSPASQSTPARPDRQEVKVSQDQQITQVPPATRALQAQPGYRAPRLTQALQELRDQLVLLDQSVQQLILERQAPQVQLGQLARLVSRALQAQRRTLELLVPRD